MPGPRMKERPADFNEEIVRKAPTFKKWEKLASGQTLTYASRSFIKGSDDDEERLMRRIWIARRNNVKDHEALKKARAAEAETIGSISSLLTNMKEGDNSNDNDVGGIAVGGDYSTKSSPYNPSGTKRRRVAGTMQPSDEEILAEMDVPAVEATRSYQKWLTLADNETFTYNQTYTKGHKNHDWLLKKNIWRRMRYRRENSARLAAVKNGEDFAKMDGNWPTLKARKVSGSAKKEDGPPPLVAKVVHDAAAAAAASSTFEPGIDAEAVAALGCPNDPIVSSALDAAAQLAAATQASNSLQEPNVDEDDDAKQPAEITWEV